MVGFWNISSSVSAYPIVQDSEGFSSNIAETWHELQKSNFKD